jgi:hypothetical protein
MGILEHILVTPSHHRVHHAINPEYIDKNHSQIFIIWDKLFGTFQAELPNVPPVYGITRPVETWNPIKINFQHLWLLIQDAWRTQHIGDKFRIWFMPTGWRPSDIVDKYPVKKVEDVYNFEKYYPVSSSLLNTWAWVQFVFTTFLVFYLFANLGRLGGQNILLYGGFIFLTVYSYTELMDRNPSAMFWEIFKNIFGISIIVFWGDWFKISEAILGGKYLILIYFVLSTFITAYFVYFDIKQTLKPNLVA